MRKLAFFTLALMSTVASLDLVAQTYQWRDANGRTIISDSPPPKNAKDSRALGTAPAPVVGQPPAAQPGQAGQAATQAPAPKTTAEKEAEFRKRQQEAKEKAEKAEKEQTAARERQEACERARRNLAMLESDQVVSMANASGQKQTLDANQRAQEIERARQMMAETCK